MKTNHTDTRNRCGALFLCCALAAGGCAATSAVSPFKRDARLEQIAAFPERQVTGVAVSPGGRVFVNFPKWSKQHDVSVVEVMPDGTIRAYPDQGWNNFIQELGSHPGTHFVCVQSVVADDRDRLWVLDPAAPYFEGPIPGGAKLVSIDLKTDRVERVYAFDDSIAPPGSYLNDVRIDPRRDYAYITDSGLGAIVVVNLQTGGAHRVLADHHSTKASPVTPVIGGRAWAGPDGETPQVHSDGIALSPDGDWLYYHALTGYRLFRVPTRALRTMHDKPNSLAAAVEDLGVDVVTDGMLTDRDGNVYFTALEYDGILKRRPTGEVVPVVIDSRLRWPDSLALGPDGWLYLTTAQIHLSPAFNDGVDKTTEPYALWRIKTDIKR